MAATGNATRWAVAAAATALAVRVVRSRHRRFLHPAGRSFTGELETAGDGRYPVTVRISKGIGTEGDRLDVRGLAVRVHLAGRELDLLLSTAGRGRLTRHLPVLRRSFDTTYGSITAYRTGAGRKGYVFAVPDPDGPALGRRLPEVGPGDRVLLTIRQGGAEHPVGRVRLGAPLSPATDAALAFDPVRNSLPELHPTGLIHGVRAFAYRLSQRWRGARPAPGNPGAVARTIEHR